MAQVEDDPPGDKRTSSFLARLWSRAHEQTLLAGRETTPEAPLDWT